MYIKIMKSRHRRDFVAIYACEHCGSEQEGSGYDDTNFHQNVIPVMVCKNCGQKAGPDYRPQTTKYPDAMVV